MGTYLIIIYLKLLAFVKLYISKEQRYPIIWLSLGMIKKIIYRVLIHLNSKKNLIFWVKVLRRSLY